MIEKTINELNSIFKKLNDHFFNGKLIKPFILIQGKVKKHTLGTCSTAPIWEQKVESGNEADRRYEITLSGEYLNRPTEEIVSTLLHEMVHLYCSLNNIKDTSNNCVYHNKRFKQEAQDHGLDVAKAPTIGWSVTTLTEPTKKVVEGFKIDETAFDYWRNAIEIEKPKKQLFKYECSCGIKISHYRQLNIKCNECNADFDDVSEDE